MQGEQSDKITYQMLWQHMAMLAGDREILLQALEAERLIRGESHRKELEMRITFAHKIANLIDWCANHADDIERIRASESADYELVRDVHAAMASGA